MSLYDFIDLKHVVASVKIVRKMIEIFIFYLHNAMCMTNESQEANNMKKYVCISTPALAQFTQVAQCHAQNQECTFL